MPGAQLEHVVFAELVAENEHAAFRREGTPWPACRRRWICRCRSARTAPNAPRVDGEVHIGDDDAAIATEFDVVKLEDGLGHDSPQWYKTEGEHRLLHGLSLRHAARACAVSFLLLLLVEHRL